MKKFLLWINVMFLFTIPSYSQTLRDEMKYSIIGQYVEEHFDTSVKQDVYIEVVSEEKLRSFSLGETKIILFNSRKKHRYYRTLSNSNGLFHFLSIRHLSNDTIDFNFTKCQLMKKGGYYGIEMESGGDLGYIPYARLIYSKEEESWKIFTHYELRENVILNLPDVFKVQSGVK